MTICDKESNGEELSEAFYQQKSVSHSLGLKSNNKKNKIYMSNGIDMIPF